MNAMRQIHFAVMLCALSAFAATAASIQSRLADWGLTDLKVPAAPYDHRLDVDAAVSRALVEARFAHKRVLIDLGANWCGDCRILAGVMELPEVRAFLNAHYVVVLADVGHFNRNLKIPLRFGISEHFNAVPALLVVDASGKLLNKGHIWEVSVTRSLTPKAVTEWLTRWAE